MMPTRVFWLTPTDLDRISLRRYHGTRYAATGVLIKDAAAVCPGPWGYHNQSVMWRDEVPRAEEQKQWEGGMLSKVPNDDPLWPTHCVCGYAFIDEDERQTNHDKLYRSGLDGKLYTLRDCPIGSMWDASWYRHDGSLTGPDTGPDGLCLVVRLPGNYDWCVDQQCSNCTRTQYHDVPDASGKVWKQWTGRTHYCWCRHGDPRTGIITVDKNGDTCAAGAGSIQTPTWHGFLHDNHLTT